MGLLYIVAIFCCLCSNQVELNVSVKRVKFYKLESISVAGGLFARRTELGFYDFLVFHLFCISLFLNRFRHLKFLDRFVHEISVEWTDGGMKIFTDLVRWSEH